MRQTNGSADLLGLFRQSGVTNSRHTHGVLSRGNPTCDFKNPGWTRAQLRHRQAADASDVVRGTWKLSNREVTAHPSAGGWLASSHAPLKMPVSSGQMRLWPASTESTTVAIASSPRKRGRCHPHRRHFRSFCTDVVQTPRLRARIGPQRHPQYPHGKADLLSGHGHQPGPKLQSSPRNRDGK